MSDDPAHHSDYGYVVFCRLDGIKSMATDRLAASVEVLAHVMADACRSAPKNSHARSYPSVYGRLGVVYRDVIAAIDLAVTVLDEAATAGVALSVGVACGDIKVVADFRRPNIAGDPPNLAARLASLPDGVGHIAVENEVFAAATSATEKYPPGKFIKRDRRRVKKTELSFYWLGHSIPVVSKTLRRITPEHTVLTAYVVVYDIVEYTQLEPLNMPEHVENLRRAVDHAGGGDLVDSEKNPAWYAPAGDGGVMVFSPGGGGRRAWDFAKHLLNYTRDRVTIRVGIAVGQVVIVGNCLPVGRGILEADELSGLAAEGGACSSKSFWGKLDSRLRDGWTAKPNSENPDGLNLIPATQDTPRSKRYANGVLRGRMTVGRFGCAIWVLSVLLGIGAALFGVLNDWMRWKGLPHVDLVHVGGNGRHEFENSIGMKFVRIEPGEFLMGSPSPGEAGRQDDATQQHPVRLTKPFYMGTTEVTRGQFNTFIKAIPYDTGPGKVRRASVLQNRQWAVVDDKSWKDPGFLQDDDHPVTAVSWEDAVAFCEWLGRQEGRTYRLPTEAEWEYACRAGTTTAYPWGDDPDRGEGWANAGDRSAKQFLPAGIKPFSWSDEFVYTAPVGRFKPNAWQIYDMIGNVWEWCADYYGPYPDGRKVVVDPGGPDLTHRKDAKRVVRGGSWVDGPEDCRAARRYGEAPDHRVSQFGFRCVLDRP